MRPGVALDRAIDRGKTILEQLSTRRHVLKAFNRLSWLVAVLYVGYAFIGGAHDLPVNSWRHFLGALILGLGLYPLALVSQALGWAVIVSGIRGGVVGIDWRDVRIYASTYLLRRLPGGVWQIAGRVAEYSAGGLGAREPLVSSAVETGLFLLSAGALYVATAFLPASSLAMVLAAAALLVAIFAFAGGWSAVRFKLGGYRGHGVAIGASYLLAAALYLGALIIAGFILFALVSSDPAIAMSAVQSMRIWAIVAAIGTIAGFLPLGFGIRDLSIAALLTSYGPPPSAILVAVLYRLLLLLGDLIFGSAFLIILNRAGQFGPSARRPDGAPLAPRSWH